MKKIKEGVYLATIALLIAACASLAYANQWQPRHETKIYYNRDTPLNNRLADLILEAEKYVYFAVYTFTKPDLKEALIGAKYRGLDVRGISEKKQYAEVSSQRTLINDLRSAGIPVGLQNHDAIMHLKVVVTEKGYASGSYNWTLSATTSNDEVLEIGYSEPVRKQYYQIMRRILREYSEG